MKKIYITILSLILLLSCSKVEEYSTTPEISFKSFNVKLKETALGPTVYGELTFNFIDGDGDIGFEQNSDTIRNNEQTDVFIKEYNSKGEILRDTVGPFYLPYFKENSYRKLLEGEVQINLPTHLADSVYYEFYIIDRAFHSSNIVTTPVYIYSEML